LRSFAAVESADLDPVSLEADHKALEVFAHELDTLVESRGCRYLALLLSLYAFSTLFALFFSIPLQQFKKKYLHPLLNPLFLACISRMSKKQPSTQVSTNPLLSSCNPLLVGVEGCGAISRYFGRHLPAINAPREVSARHPDRSGGHWRRSSRSRAASNRRRRASRTVGGGRFRYTNPCTRCRAGWPGL
jgi:hypothetical protein